MTRSSTKELFTPYEEPKRVLHSARRLFKTTSLDYSSLQEFNFFLDLKDQFEEEVAKTMGEPTIKEYMTITRKDYDSGINEKGRIELKGRSFLEFSNNALSGTNREDAVEHIENFLKIKANGAYTKVEWDPTNIEFENWTENDTFQFETSLFKAFDEFTYPFQIDVDVLTNDIQGFKTYDEYKNKWMYEWYKDIPWVADRPWVDYGPWKEPTYDIDHVCKPFRFKSGHVEWPTCNWKEDGYCNTGDLP
nr:hypothetical protein [Tanacetum cinerariifolium]